MIEDFLAYKTNLKNNFFKRLRVNSESPYSEVYLLKESLIIESIFNEISRYFN